MILSAQSIRKRCLECAPPLITPFAVALAMRGTDGSSSECANERRPITSGIRMNGDYTITGKPASARPRSNPVHRARKGHKDRKARRVHAARSRVETPPPVCSRGGDNES